jgi:hypothetical protein
MALRKPRSLAAALRPPAGKIRQSQVVTTFGPGAMVDLLDKAVLIGGLDFWRYGNTPVSPVISEPRLVEALKKTVEKLGLELNLDAPFKRPPTGDDKEPSEWNGIQVAEFPAWFVCQGCRALETAASLEMKNGRHVHACSRSELGECVPVRFVAACTKGHLEEFPWRWFAHREECSAPELKLLEGASGDFAEIRVVCESCKQSRSLADARHKQALPLCRGLRPWLGGEGGEPCGEHAQLMTRTASNAYFSQSVSALTIPEPGKELRNTLLRPDVWKSIKDADAEDVSYQRRKIEFIKKALEGYSDEAVFSTLQSIRSKKAPPREALRTAEFRQFLEQKDEKEGEQPPEGVEFWARRLVRKDPQTLLPEQFSRIIVARKLREVRAQIGFSRFSSVSPSLQGEFEDGAGISPLGLTTDWLPATEIHGEGVLLCLDEQAVKLWEERPAVLARGKELLAGFLREYPEGSGGPAFPGVRFYLLHTLSHLLSSAISLRCGYAASAIRERIYCAAANEELPMAAILLSTGTAGAEGTLGGLVEQGRHMRLHLQRAWDMGVLCSNDPVCAGHDPGDQSERFLEGAACHGCVFIAENACERFNRFLDRALVVPTMEHDPELSFLKEGP